MSCHTIFSFDIILVYKDYKLNGLCFHYSIRRHSLGVIYGKGDKITIEKRLTSDNKIQVKLTYKRGNEEFIDNVFQELHKRLTEYEK